MSAREHWNAGDIALCIHEIDWLPQGVDYRMPPEGSPVVAVFFPSPGTAWRVQAVSQAHNPGALDPEPIYLGLEGQPSDHRFCAEFFTKLRTADAEQHCMQLVELEEAHELEPAT